MLLLFLSLAVGHCKKVVSNAEGFHNCPSTALILSIARVHIAFWLLVCIEEEDLQPQPLALNAVFLTNVTLS